MSKSWGVLSEKIFTEDGNYLINHSSSIILLKDGKYLSRISHHAKYEDIFKNINKLFFILRHNCFCMEIRPADVKHSKFFGFVPF